MKLGLLLLSLLFSACALKPTTLVTNRERQDAKALAASGEAIKITQAMVVIDVRPAFEFSTAHLPHSVSLQWYDYTEPDQQHRGVLLADTFASARRLSRFGVDPNAAVVVLGRGKSGEGEEGRVAWMLKYFGVKNVQFADFDAVKARVTSEEDAPPKSVPEWEPSLVSDLNVERPELLFAINKKATHTPAAYHEGEKPVLYRIVDVRPSSAYLGREGLALEMHIPNIDSTNIPWTDFFGVGLSRAPDMRKRLESVGIKPEQRLIVIDEDGVSSAAVTLALRDLGFSRAGNLSGGLRDFLANYENK